MEYLIKNEPLIDAENESKDNFLVPHDKFQPTEEVFVKKEDEVEIYDELESQQELECHICHELFDTDKALYEHYGVHVKKKKKKIPLTEKVPCEVCGTKVFFSHYNSHLKSKHKNLPPKKCEVCQKKFRGKYLHDRHFKKFHQKERSCNECESLFNTKAELHRHIREVHFIKDPSLRNECPKCGVRYLPENEESHISICKSEKRLEQPFICLECKIRFKAENGLVRHRPAHGTESYECDVCAKIYPSKPKMEKHLLTTHFRKTPVITCKLCAATFNRRAVYIKHIPVCPKRLKDFKCDLCQKIMKNALNLRRHKELLHMDGKKFKCECCSAEFRSKPNLNRHLLVHFKKPFSCNVCRKRYQTEKELEQHAILHLDPKSFECKECFLIFKSNGHLKTHVRTMHLPHEKYSCHYCEKEFSQIRGLMMHLDNYLIKRNCNIKRSFSLTKKIKNKGK